MPRLLLDTHKLSLSMPTDRFVLNQITENGFRMLSIELRHAAKLESLPFHCVLLVDTSARSNYNVTT